jgi:hypothetical protein
MRFAAFAFVSIMAAVLFAAPPAHAAASEHGPSAFAVEISALALVSEASGQREHLQVAAPDPRVASLRSAARQAVTVRQRPRARIRVTPRYPRRNTITFYPLPYGIDYPGPNAVRLCDFRLAQERRPSGTVIVPRQRCWWARQR